MIKVEKLLVYPIKSSWSLSLRKSAVTNHGLLHDRNYAIFDRTGQALTAREFPDLLDVHCKLTDDSISITHQKKEIGQIPIESTSSKSRTLKIFSYTAYGNTINKELDQWFSDFLNINCQLMSVDPNSTRPVLEKHGGKENDRVGFSDQAPILILSEASLRDLNFRLENQIGMERFRPNIVVSGCEAYEEDNWDIIEIGRCTFRVIQQCERCVLTTIDPITKIKDKMNEPLRTLAKYRKGSKGGVVMGAHAVPFQTGSIAINDEVIVGSTITRPVTAA